MIYGLIFVAAATTAPSPTPSTMASQGACDKPNREAVVLNVVLPKVFPYALHDALANGAQTPAVVQISVGADGKVQQATIYRSTGSAMLDNAAVEAAKATTFAPKRVNCQPIGGVYLESLPF